MVRYLLRFWNDKKERDVFYYDGFILINYIRFWNDKEERDVFYYDGFIFINYI